MFETLSNPQQIVALNLIRAFVAVATTNTAAPHPITPKQQNTTPLPLNAQEIIAAVEVMLAS